MTHKNIPVSSKLTQIIEEDIFDWLQKVIDRELSHEEVLASNFHEFLRDARLERNEDRKRASFSDAAWIYIAQEYDCSKLTASKYINRALPNKIRRYNVLRDIGNAYSLYHLGFYKESVVTSGGVIEELLRLYIEYNGISTNGKSFHKLIEICKDRNLSKRWLTGLADVVREFRNAVHLENEKTRIDSITRSQALNAFASIFSLIDSFKVLPNQTPS